MKRIERGIETRTLKAELRADADKNKFQIHGTAASYGVLSHNLGGFRERIAPGAFTKTLADAGADVHCLLNHDMNLVLGRRKNGTLQLTDGRAGLGFICQLNKDSVMHRDIYAAVQRGDLDGCSFAFQCPEDGCDWDDATDERGVRYVRRTLRSVNLLDVSIVSSPAYPEGTSVSARSERRAQPFVADYVLPILSRPTMSDREIRRRVAEIGFQVAADKAAENGGFMEVRVGPREQDVRFIPFTAAMRDALNRKRCEEIGEQIAVDSIDESIPADLRHAALRAEVNAFVRELLGGEARDLWNEEDAPENEYWLYNEDELGMLHDRMCKAVRDGDPATAALLANVVSPDAMDDEKKKALLEHHDQAFRAGDTDYANLLQRRLDLALAQGGK
jgi:hypothetical protein